MNVSLEESVAIYARATRKWFGGNAHEKTRERIDQFAKAGDWEGARVHRLVCERLSQMERQHGGAHSRLMSTGSEGPQAGG